jgi:hypothetical protein
VRGLSVRRSFLNSCLWSLSQTFLTNFFTLGIAVAGPEYDMLTILLVHRLCTCVSHARIDY